jgi:hypothetical protein
MGSNSATKVPSQQSVKAYVDTAVAGKDNTDEITEGSTNLYYTDARVEAVSINNIVEDTSPQLGGDLDVNGNSITSVSNGDVNIAPHGTGNVSITSTGAFVMPVGTTAQRPVTAVVGMMRFNSDVDAFEGYNGASWVKIGWSYASDYGLITETSEVFTTNYGSITDTDTSSYTTDRGLITEDVIY